MDGELTPSPSSATLPRNGPSFPIMKLPPVDSTNEGRTSEESLIPLTQTVRLYCKPYCFRSKQCVIHCIQLVSQRPPRVHAEQRKSQSWTGSGDNNRSSVISITAYPSEPGSRTSVNSPCYDSAIDDTSSDDTPAPPLPPKLHREKVKLSKFIIGPV